MSHSVQMTRACAPLHASYGSLVTVTSSDTALGCPQRCWVGTGPE
uniref:Uncharacterized protein n=1 Tax=Anguilla anguilla TaxID=7936 RepID=A0A0E9V2U8_ANGAN